ncbi:MAG: hypothetical protein M1821_004860 [Bathelium mastoideum]|nr:MAG: hypothetical protein M1821_004860 [Bathelium mastoideum]KAI9689094.1 MAG: hypothetical protein M1822_000831 [Bathelium mastoideum]
MTGSNLNLALHPRPDAAAAEYIEHSRGLRVSTDAVLEEALRAQYPHLHLTASPRGLCNLLAFAAAGHATCTPVDEEPGSQSTAIKWRFYRPPARRLDGESGMLWDAVVFEKYAYQFKEHEFILYVVTGTEGAYPNSMHYILSVSPSATDELIAAASQWSVDLHNEIWLFDRGFWQKSAELWQNMQKMEWGDVILPEDKKQAIIRNVEHFFDSRQTYEKLKVPWKRGVIFHGPPGNGKTISIKATMHSLYKRKDPVPTLYVQSIAGYGGPEFMLNMIFSKARQTAPCYLVFEDLDSIVSDATRSYFFNQVDGLRANDGIFMVGSTNHLDQLDPGIAKRPSRFDRKFYFPEPDLQERIQYCHYWQRKLADNKEIEFPDKLCKAIAKSTDKFSFAYLQEAFVAALLVIAFEHEGEDANESPLQQYSEEAAEATPDAASDLIDVSVPGSLEKGDDDDLDDLLLWRVIQQQIKLLREELESEHERVTKKRIATERAEMGVKRAAVRELQHGRYGDDD